MAAPAFAKMTNPRMGYSTDGARGMPTYLFKKQGDANGAYAIPPYEVTVNLDDPGSYHIIYNATVACMLCDVRAVWAVAEVTAVTCNLQLERLQGTEAPGSGDKLLAATAVNVKGTVNTLASPAIIVAGNIHKLAAGDRLGIEFAVDAGTVAVPTELANVCVTLRFVPQAPEVASATM